MRGITTVLDAKIQIPRQPPGLLPRQRLVDALHDHVDCKLQYVIAPAGFGKTTLLAEFVHEAALPVCWATLDPGDRDTATFVESVVAAVRGVVPRFGARTLAALHGAPDLDARASALARLFLSEFQQQSDALTLLVLDDYHEVESGGPVTQFMNELLRLLPDNLRVVVAGRSLPDLTISRLLVERQVFGLGEADLRFTAAELATLLRRSGHNVTAEQATALADGAEGWIAGFLLSVPQLWEGLVAGMIAGSSGESPLYTYLAAEAFDRQPLDVQRFLLNTSVPETFDMELATCLLGQGDWPAMVDRIERAGLFLTRLPSARGTFRYHQLFRAFLQARLRAGAAGEFARLHGVAAAHLAERGAWQAALPHLREAGKVRQAAALLASLAPDLERTNRWRALADAVAGLPLEAADAHPSLVLSAARAALHTGDAPRAESFAERVRDVATRTGDPHLEAWALTCLGQARRLQGRTAEALALFDRGRQRAGTDDELLAVIRRYVGKCLGVQGDFAGAATALREALAHFDRTGAAYDAAQAEFGLGVALAKCGRLAEAIACYESALGRWRELGDVAMEAEMRNCLGCAYAYRGEYPRARAALEEALARAYDAGSPLTQAAALHSLGDVLLATGELAAARTAAEQGLAVAREIGESWVATHLHDTLALLSLFEGDLPRAEEHAHYALALARRQASPYLEALCSVTLGVVLCCLGRPEALRTVEDAAKALESTGAQRELAHAHLWLAQLRFRTGREATARRNLEVALRLARTLGSDGILDLHVRWDPALFTRCAADGVEPERLEAALRRVRGVASAAPRALAVSFPSLAARAFGHGALVLDETDEVAWTWDKTREIFFFLLHHGPRRREQIVAALWPDSPPERAKSALHTSIYRLRRAVHPDVILVRDGVYRINEELVTYYDVREFERLVREARADAGESSAAVLRQASDLSAAPFLEGIDAEWCGAERDRLERDRLACLEALIDAEARAGRWRESIDAAGRFLTLEPLREDVHARVVRNYLRLGDQAAAKRQLERCQTLLWDELAITPGPELQALQRRIRA